MHRRLGSFLVTSALLAAGMAPAAASGQDCPEIFKLLPVEGSASDRFGESVDIFGSTIVIGVSEDDDNGTNSGSAFVFDAITGAQVAKLLADDGTAGDRFGCDVAIEGDFILIGAEFRSDGGRDIGAVYVFDATTFEQVRRIVPPTTQEFQRFGTSLDLSGTTAVIAATGDQTNGSRAGAAYLYDVTTGAQIAKLVGSEVGEDDEFGHSVSIDGDLAIVGSWLEDDQALDSGAAYIFDAVTGAEIRRIIPGVGGERYRFGAAVSISGTTAVVGAYLADDGALDGGAAYVFDTATGEQTQLLLASDAGVGDLFGFSVFVSDDRALVGARSDDNARGSAYLFDVTTGEQIAKLQPEGLASSDQFGEDVAFFGDDAVVGAFADNDLGTNSGAAYTFDLACETDCLELAVENLVGGQTATFTIRNGTPGGRVATVYGTQPGSTTTDDFRGDNCATFDIADVRLNDVVGGFDQVFDADGVASFTVDVPERIIGTTLLFQSAAGDTCPDECVSNVVTLTVQ